MSAEYAKALKDYWYFNSKDPNAQTIREQAEATLKRLAPTEGAKNSFKSNPNDETISVDVLHLTNEQATELSLFAADLINQARKAVGSSLIEVTTSSVTDAKEQGEFYSKSDMTFVTLNHDTSEIDAKANNRVDEDLYYWSGGTLKTLADAKRYVYNSVTGWIFDKTEWLHATSVVRTRNFTMGDSYVGIGLYKLVDNALGVNLSIFNNDTVTNYSNPDGGKLPQDFSLTAIENPYSSDKIIAAYNTTKTALDTAKAVALQTPTAQAQVSAAQIAYTTAQERLAKANQAVATLNADVKQKQAQVATAKQVLATKTVALQATQTVLAQAKTRLASLQTTLATAQNNVLVAKANVDKAQANLSQAQAVYETTAQAYQVFIDAQEQARLKAEYDTLVAQGNQPIPAVDDTSKITGYTALAPETSQSASTAQGQTGTQAKPVTATPTTTKASTPVASTITKTTANSLPITGDTTSNVAILFGTVLTLFGLVGVRKKETK